jgi:hypothetical protein
LLVSIPDRGKQLYSPCTVLRAPEDDGRREKSSTVRVYVTPRGRLVDDDKHRLPEQIACQRRRVQLKRVMQVTCHTVKGDDPVHSTHVLRVVLMDYSPLYTSTCLMSTLLHSIRIWDVVIFTLL